MTTKEKQSGYYKKWYDKKKKDKAWRKMRSNQELLRYHRQKNETNPKANSPE